MNNYYDLLDDVIKDIKDLDEYKKLKELEEYINLNYDQEIKDFKNNELKLEEVKKYGKYHPDYEKVLKSFLESKEKLYNIKEVIEYKRLERIINQKLDDISKEVKSILWLKEKD